MAEAWHQTADGYQIKVEAPKHRQGVAAQGLALGVVPIVVDVPVTAIIESPVASDGRILIQYSPVPGAKLGDSVVVTPTAKTPPESPGNELYGLTIGPCCVPQDGALEIILQNRTAAPIVLAADFHVRACVLHILPAAPAAP